MPAQTGGKDHFICSYEISVALPYRDADVTFRSYVDDTIEEIRNNAARYFEMEKNKVFIIRHCY